MIELANRLNGMDGVAIIIVIGILLFGGVLFTFWLERQAKKDGKGDE